LDLFKRKYRVTSEEQKNEGVSKGFAGLSSMISDVEDVVTSVEARKSESLPDVDAVKIHRSEPQPADDEVESILDPYQQSPGVSSELKWLVIVGVIILGLSWLNSEPTNKSSVPPHIDYSTPPPNVNSTAAHEDSQHAPKHPSGPIRPTEEKPPVGTCLNFNAAQIRYCLAEDIRLGQAKEIINNYLTSDVDRFNAMVTDYNSRCGHFRYRTGALESAKSDVERYRENLESEGRDRFTRHSPKGSQQIPANSQLPKPDNMIVDLQKRLNELGYDAGKADGLAGGKTRTAIMSVQRALGIPVNGIANIDLLKRLDSANPRSNAQVVVQPTLPTDKIIPPAIEPRMPNIVEPEVGKPDLSGANRSEQEAIEKACNSTRQYSGPAAYYDCLTREVNGLSAYRGKPDLSSASRSEQEAIEKACNSTRQYSGPAAYYDCLTREIQNSHIR
jgi:peptidoglycan hydrolase-like protein with peptidoglycan-binding domain